jgi:hypothetical protein
VALLASAEFAELWPQAVSARVPSFPFRATAPSTAPQAVSVQREPSALQPAVAVEAAWVAAELPRVGAAAVSDAAELRQAAGVREASVAQPRVEAEAPAWAEAPRAARPSEGLRAVALSAAALACRRGQALPWLAPSPAARLAHAMAR